MSEKVGAQLLGVSLVSLYEKRTKLFGKLVLSESPITNLEKSASLIATPEDFANEIQLDEVEDMNGDEDEDRMRISLAT